MAKKDSTLTQEDLNSLYEYKDGYLYLKKTKGNKTAGEKIGHNHHSGYVYTTIDEKFYSVHRIIFAMHHGYFPKFIDHIDGNRSNNKIENLREATIFENNRNAKIRKNNTSGIKGVHFVEKHKKWVVQLQINKQKKYFGWYDNLELAELVAQEARSKYHGKFARDF